MIDFAWIVLQAPAVLVVRVVINVAAGLVVGLLETAEELKSLWRDRDAQG